MAQDALVSHSLASQSQYPATTRAGFVSQTSTIRMFIKYLLSDDIQEHISGYELAF